MPKTSHIKLLEEWDALLAGLRATAPHFGNTAFLQAFLTQALREAREIRKRQEQLTAARREANKRLQQILDRGHDKAMRTRNYLRFKLGPYNEELTRFGINPIRRGGARKAV
jgi:histidinol-phosphate/aromatic aminotransferase/cobyric acid decarboxylase-like protein